MRDRILFVRWRSDACLVSQGGSRETAKPAAEPPFKPRGVQAEAGTGPVMRRGRSGLVSGDADAAAPANGTGGEAAAAAAAEADAGLRLQVEQLQQRLEAGAAELAAEREAHARTHRCVLSVLTRVGC